MSDVGFSVSVVAPRPFLDRLDTRVRLVAAVATVMAALVVRSPTVLAAMMVVAVAAAFAAGLSVRDLGRRLVHVEGFLVVLALILPVTVPGPTWAAIGPLELSRPGIDRAVLILLRVNLSAVAILILLAGLEPVRLGHGLARLGMPTRLVHLMLFAARWVALVGEEARRLHEALRARAFTASASAHGLRTTGHFVGQLLVRAFERAERVDEAMRCRAFAGRFALVSEERPTRRDAIFAAGLALSLLTPILLDRLT